MESLVADLKRLRVGETGNLNVRTPDCEADSFRQAAVWNPSLAWKSHSRE